MLRLSSALNFPQFKPNQADRIRHKTASATIPHLILYQHCHKTIPYHTRQYCAISNHTRQYHIMSQHTKHTVPNHTKDIIQHLVPFQHCHKTIPNSLRQKFLSPLCGHISQRIAEYQILVTFYIGSHCIITENYQTIKLKLLLYFMIIITVVDL